MKKRNLKEEDLPKILEELKTRAIDGNGIFLASFLFGSLNERSCSLDQIASSNWSLAFGREDLEGVYLQVKRIQRRIQTVAGNMPWLRL